MALIIKDFSSHFIPFIIVCSTIALDSFFSSASYKASGIKMSALCCIIISFVGALCFGIPLVFGNMISQNLSVKTANIICFILLVTLGLFQTFSSVFKDKIKKKNKKEKEKSIKKNQKKVSFKFFNLRFILQVYADNSSADIDKSKIISAYEALFLAFALSFDSVAVGFSSAFGAKNEYIFLYILICFVINLMFIYGGILLGCVINKIAKIDLSWISGVVLIIIGILKLF